MKIIVNKAVITTTVKFLFCISVIIVFMLSTDTVNAATEQWESESNDYIQQADTVSIANGNSINGYSKYNEVDYYKFTLSKGSKVKILMTSYGSKLGEGTGSLEVDLFSSNNLNKIMLFESAYYKKEYGYNREQVIWYLAQGTYYLKIELKDPDKRKYKLQFETREIENFNEPNNYIGQATEIVSNKKYHGITTYDKLNGNDIDYFKFKLNKAGKYYVTVKNYYIVKEDDKRLDYLFFKEGQTEKAFYGGYIFGAETNTELVNMPAGENVFQVYATNKGEYEFQIVKQLSAPQKAKAELYGYDDIKLSWSAVDGAKEYKIYYHKDSGNPYDKTYTYYTSTKSTTIKIANLSTGTGYKFKIIPRYDVNGITYSAASKMTSYVYTLKKLNRPTVKKSSRYYTRVYWNNIPGESGYEIARSKYSTKKFSIVKRVSYKYKSTTIKTPRNVKYYYKVRAYKTVNGQKIYGPWSQATSYKL